MGSLPLLQTDADRAFIDAVVDEPADVYRELKPGRTIEFESKGRGWERRGLMVDDRVLGLSENYARIRVTAAEVAAAKLKVERAEARGEQVDPAVRAIAAAKHSRARIVTTAADQ
jgi:hypothetical protein